MATVLQNALGITWAYILGGGGYIQNNIFVCKGMGLNPEGGGGGFNMGFYDNFASLLTAVNAMSFKHE